jgi:hypothetical protein
MGDRRVVCIVLSLLTVLATSCSSSPLASPSPGPTLRDDVPPDEASGALQAYGEQHADEFGGLYFDQPSGVLVLRFTGHLDEHALAVTALAHGAPVRVLPCQHTERDFRAVQDDITERIPALRAQGIEPLQASVDVIRNITTFDAKSDLPGVEAMLEAEYAGKLDVTIYPLPGPWQNVASGPGWRLVANGPSETGLAYSVRVATDAASWAALWTEVNLGQAAPSVDFEHEIVAAFGEGLSQSCPEIRLDGITIDHSARLVYHRTSDPMSPRGCRLDLSASDVFVVALKRSALPPSPFVVQLLAPGDCDDCGSQARVTVVLP